MKRTLGVVVAVTVVMGLAGAALAWGPGGHGMMGGRGMGPEMMGPGAGGPGGCPGMAGVQDAPVSQVTEEKAKELAVEYAGKHRPGFAVERVLPFTGRIRTMYQVELKGPGGETRLLHVNPWGA